MDIDALVVGGSFAGISAALQLARARRQVCVVDAGAPRNRFAQASHGFFGHDGRAPLELMAQARAQLLAYPSVRFIAAQATEAAPQGEGFALALDNGERLVGRRLLLATGVRDLLPELPGLAERWGQSVAHCPYCHGYEFDRQPLGVLYRMPLSLHQAQLIAEWGPTTLFLDGHTVSDDERAHMAALGVAVEPGKVLALEGEGTALAGVRLAGRVVPLRGLFLAPTVVMASPLAEQLGCAFETAPAGSFIRVEMGQTSVPGVFAAGDAATAWSNAAQAAAAGSLAGAAMHRAMVFG
ncbi:NAD(P)/FAD-dependent oxidoreductase [Pseudorhodoferax sp. Leaf265]|jgi:thioredoxin reductase|uniref:NAD(P)/FAD-dependent oxidoreductase n=1 Tax=Pseudorhodoferax sp. Leaf265 TaxID=1736315 RepID=UPI0006FE285B|nr:NAD(P)/FAD-dependent oxidoreductase [Pseudorhodoferax sp. Leaf265]KQP15283.1 thioredoxin reductase [Pseudorhodoferax sp. Leaf265]